MSLASSFAGATWETPHAPSRLIAVELDGRGIAYAWRPDVLTDERVYALKFCLDRGPAYRPQGRAAPPNWERMGLVSEEVSRCVREARLPPPTREAIGPLWTFDMWMRVDDDRMAQGAGTPILS